ncbi:MAG: hypothetical protein A2W25_05175 [candidate division Zixibacteria bacterium RBG_16_53_22]|nr:MAG: hypothetical protein A2W25_05175 [candidate division Zixibacteria bacterium RBG_16_53_22]
MDIQIGTTKKLVFVLLDIAGNEVTGLGSTFTVTYSKNGVAFVAGSGAKTEVGSGAYTYDQVADETDTQGPLLYEIIGAGTDVQRLLYEVVGYLSTPHLLGTIFATIQDIEAFLQIEITTPAQILSAQRALIEATAAIRNYTHQYLGRVDDDAITLDSKGWTRMFLPELPVIDVSAVVEDGETLTVDDDYKLGQYGVLHRIGQKWASGIQIITITYSHGYETIPDDIVAVCTRAASRGYQAGLRAADSAGVMGVASKQLGDFSVSFVSEAGGGVGEGVMGASAARMLLLSEKEMLDKYRM